MAGKSGLESTVIEENQLIFIREGAKYREREESWKGSHYVKGCNKMDKNQLFSTDAGEQ